MFNLVASLFNLSHKQGYDGNCWAAVWLGSSNLLCPSFFVWWSLSIVPASFRIPLVLGLLPVTGCTSHQTSLYLVFISRGLFLCFNYRNRHSRLRSGWVHVVIDSSGYIIKYSLLLNNDINLIVHSLGHIHSYQKVLFTFSYSNRA